MTEKPGTDHGVLGIVTLEDVVEVSLDARVRADNQELIGKEIIVSSPCRVCGR